MSHLGAVIKIVHINAEQATHCSPDLQTAITCTQSSNVLFQDWNWQLKLH